MPLLLYPRVYNGCARYGRSHLIIGRMHDQEDGQPTRSRSRGASVPDTSRLQTIGATVRTRRSFCITTRLLRGVRHTSTCLRNIAEVHVKSIEFRYASTQALSARKPSMPASVACCRQLQGHLQDNSISGILYRFKHSVYGPHVICLLSREDRDHPLYFVLAPNLYQEVAQFIFSWEEVHPDHSRASSRAEGSRTDDLAGQSQNVHMNNRTCPGT